VCGIWIPVVQFCMPHYSLPSELVSTWRPQQVDCGGNSCWTTGGGDEGKVAYFQDGLMKQVLR